MTLRRAKYLRNRTRGRSIPFGWDVYYHRAFTRAEMRLVYVLARAAHRRMGVWIP